jgi:urease accessory protein
MSGAISRYDALERGNGVAEVGFAARGGRTVLAHLFQRTPCRVLFPRVEADDPVLAVLLTTSGGLAGGDRVRLAGSVAEGAVATLTTQAAEKIYRSLGPETRVDLSLDVADGAWLEYLPQETILFDGARLVRRSRAAVAPGGRLLAADLVIFGRSAHGEALTRGLWHDGWQVQVGGRLAWADALRLDGDIATRLAAAAGFHGAAALGTALYAGDDAPPLLETARGLAAAAAGRAGATLVGGVLLARFLAPEAAVVRGDLMRYLAGLRHAAAGLPVRLSRLWHD